MSSVVSDLIDDADSQVVVDEGPNRCTDYLNDCSCYILHRDTRLRKWCMSLAEPTEVILKMKYLLKVGKIEEYVPDDDIANEVLFKPEPNGKKDRDLEALQKLDEDSGPAKKFDNIILVLIALSSIALVIDNPLYDPESQFMNILKVIDIVFTVLFFIEATIKILAKGFLFNRLGPV